MIEMTEQNQTNVYDDIFFPSANNNDESLPSFDLEIHETAFRQEKEGQTIEQALPPTSSQAPFSLVSCVRRVGAPKGNKQFAVSSPIVKNQLKNEPTILLKN